MISIQSPEVKEKLACYQRELRSFTGDNGLFLVATKVPDWKIDLTELAEIIVHVTGVSLEQMQSKVRKRDRVIARQLLCYYSRKVTTSGLHEVGKFLGHRDHSTVIHSDATIKDLIQTGNQQVINLIERVNFYLDELKKRSV